MIFLLIEELRALGKSERLKVLHRLGNEAAAYFAQTVPEACERFSRVIVLTHVSALSGSVLARRKNLGRRSSAALRIPGSGVGATGSGAGTSGMPDYGALRTHAQFRFGRDS